MNSFAGLRVALLLTVWAVTSPGPTAAQTNHVLPSPLNLGDVIRLASERRDEIQAARARVRAGEARPSIVSALEDPMISPSLDHLPFMLGDADVSFTIEQQIPLSGIRPHRRASALADVDRLRAEASRTTLDVGIQAANAFLMVQERRRTEALVSEQLAFARDVVSAANARYASGTAPQSDVLRAEVEVARFAALARALVSEVRGAEAMLNTSLALDADGPVPPLATLAFAQPPPSWSAIKAALTSRPELVAGRGSAQESPKRKPCAPCRKPTGDEAIFYVQRELEVAGDSHNPAVVLCDRGTIDGVAYWPGSSEEFWSSLGTTLDIEFRRYDAVIHLRTPAQEHGYNHQNPLRTESAVVAADIDARIARVWERHPRRFIVESSVEFLDKAARALQILRGEMPECCQQHVLPTLRDHRTKAV